MRGNIIRAIVFDLDDTLYDSKTAQRAGADAWTAYAKEQFQLPGKRTRREIEALIAEQAEKMGPIAASHSRVLRAEFWLAKRNLPVFPHATALTERYWQALLDAMVPRESAVEMLRDLQMRGFLIGIGTNMTAYVRYKKIGKLGLGDIVDFIVTSEECGMDKPLHHLFKYSAKKANETLAHVGRTGRIEMNEILFVGDSVKRGLEGAHAAKMQALLFDPENAHPEEEERIQRFSELPEVLKRPPAEM